jgi:hypothetical protein
VLILLVSNIAVAKSKGFVLKMGFIYIAAVYTTYFLAGLGLTFFFSSIPLVYAEYISIVVGSIVVLSGLLEIKDYFWYGRGFSLAIPVKYSKKLHNYAQSITYPGLIFLGVFAAGVELPCTGGPYLANAADHHNDPGIFRDEDNVHQEMEAGQQGLHEACDRHPPGRTRLAADAHSERNNQYRINFP